MKTVLVGECQACTDILGRGDFDRQGCIVVHVARDARIYEWAIYSGAFVYYRPWMKGFNARVGFAMPLSGHGQFLSDLTPESHDLLCCVVY